MPLFDQRSAWDAIADRYQSEVAPAEALIHYGPWAPPEAELRLLGDVRGLDVLEIGCGGGQCSVAFARQGARVTGLDLSSVQIHYAQLRAAAANVAVEFVVGDAADMSAFANEGWDLIFATYVLPYVEPVERALAECWRTLRAGGRLVCSQDHPVRALFYDEEEQEIVPYPVRNYFVEGLLHWRFPGSERPLQSHYFTVAGWIDRIYQAGFELVRLVEAPAVEEIAATQWPEDDPTFFYAKSTADVDSCGR